MTNGKNSPHILLVDDDEDDLFLSRRILSKSADCTVADVSDGSDAIRYLDGVGVYADRNRYPLPDLLLLDLKMPEVTGFEVLDWIRRQPRFGKLRVYVLTSSNEERDRHQASASGATGYFVKPLSLGHILKIQGRDGSG